MKYQDIIFIVIINALPFFGVVYWGWNLSTLLFVYWLESLIVGIANFAKLTVSNGPGSERAGKVFFFTVHYGLFWIVHGVFLFALLLPRIWEYSVAADEDGFFTSLEKLPFIFWGLVVSYAVSTALYMMQTPRAKRLTPVAQMFAPYGRVFIMHIVILGGAFLLARYADAMPVLLLFIGLKLVFDIASQWIGRSLTSQTQGAAS